MATIGFDARMYGPNHGGIGRYIAQIIKEYFTYESQDQMVLFMTSEGRKEIGEVPKWVSIIEVDIPWYGIKEQVFFSSIIEKAKVDGMHFPHWNVPLSYKGKYIVTIHDLIMFHYSRKEATTRSIATYWIKDAVHRKVVSSAVERATHILTPSMFTKHDVVDTFKISPEKITVTYEGITKFNSQNTSASQLPPEVLDTSYLLYVGSAYPHKNLDRLIDAWEQYVEDHLSEKLVIAGKKDRFFERLEVKIKEKGTSNIIFLSSISDTQLEALYRHARAFVFPSLYEGFGLPPLEAMQYHIPVLASNRSCIPEILGEGAYFVDPEDVDALTDGIDVIMHNTEIRGALQQATYQELARYSWKSCALQTWNAYKKIK